MIRTLGRALEGPDGTTISTERPPVPNISDRVEVIWHDKRLISPDQRKKAYALMAEIAEWSGATPDEIKAGFNSMTKRHIKASEKNGVINRYGRSQAEIDIFFELHKEMADRQGITYRPKEYFERLVNAFPELRIYTSEYEGEMIGAMMGLPYGDRMWYVYGGTKTMRGAKVSPGYLLIWDLIKWGAELGLDYFNMGGTYSLDMEDGLFFFKHGFCKADEPFVWVGELDVVLDR